MTVSIQHIEERLRASGLEPMGAFHPGADDRVPPLSDGSAARTVVLAGNVGAAMWQAFSPSRESGPDALDSWSRDRMTRLAAELGATPVFITQGPPFPPVQQWAMRAGPCKPSPLGILIHPDHGLWHAFRGALSFRQLLDLPTPDRRPSPCASCDDKPCLTTCPVAAFDGKAYDVAACTGYLDSAGGADCLGLGCRARRACPVGREYIYEPAQARHHMTAFLRANRG